MTNDKKQILNMLKEQFSAWEELLGGMSEEQITGPQLPSNWSVKDVIAHLWAWQQISVARLEAALHNREPQYPQWPAYSEGGAQEQAQEQARSSDPEEDVDQANAWIYEVGRKKAWPVVYGDWRTQFRHFLQLGEMIHEEELTAPGRYTWLGEYALSDVLLGSYEHHREHLEQMLALPARA